MLANGLNKLHPSDPSEHSRERVEHLAGLGQALEHLAGRGRRWRMDAYHGATDAKLNVMPQNQLTLGLDTKGILPAES